MSIVSFHNSTCRVLDFTDVLEKMEEGRKWRCDSGGWGFVQGIIVWVQLVSFRAEGSSKIQARIEQQATRASQPPSTQFRAPTKPAVGPKASPVKDNPSPEPQLDDIKRGTEVIMFCHLLFDLWAGDF